MVTIKNRQITTGSGNSYDPDVELECLQRSNWHGQEKLAGDIIVVKRSEAKLLLKKPNLYRLNNYY